MTKSHPDVRACPFIVLSGGDNARLDVLQGTIYKPFLELRNTTLIAKHVHRAVLSGHRSIRIVVDHRDPMAAAYVAELSTAPDVDVALVAVDGDARTKIIGVLDQYGPGARAMVVLGDTYGWYDSRQLLARLSSPGAACCLAVARYRLPFGVVDLSGGRVVEFREKPVTEYLVNLGVMALGGEAIGALRDGLSVAQMLAHFAAGGQLGGVEVPNGFLTIDSLDGVARALGVENQGLLDN